MQWGGHTVLSGLVLNWSMPKKIPRGKVRACIMTNWEYILITNYTPELVGHTGSKLAAEKEIIAF